mmetsp:Transcript_142898/g.398118  ORF Transcript_142898/g.398118 Transcript_142898/m.398118 type:complete len:298 (-) Transcript_142898:93-986(-)
MWMGPVPTSPVIGAGTPTGGTGSEGSSQLSDVHAKWSEKGAHEFVPFGMGSGGSGMPTAAPNGGGGVPRMVPVGTRGSIPGRERGYLGVHHPGPLMGAWPGATLSNSREIAPPPSGLRVPGPWGPMNNGGPPPDAHWTMSGPGSGLGPGPGPGFGALVPPAAGMQPSPLQPPTAPPKPQTVVVAWNLNPTYTAKELQNELSEIDFHPDKLKMCQDLLEGAFLLWFTEAWHANALIASLDDTEEHLSPREGQRLQMVRWACDSPTWNSKEIPAPLQTALPKLLQAEKSVTASGVDWKE